MVLWQPKLRQHLLPGPSLLFSTVVVAGGVVLRVGVLRLRLLLISVNLPSWCEEVCWKCELAYLLQLLIVAFV